MTTIIVKDNSILVTLSDRVRYAREKRGLTQADLTDKIGASKGTVGVLEQRATNRSKHTRALATALNVNYEWLLDGIGTSGLDKDGSTMTDNNKVSMLKSKFETAKTMLNNQNALPVDVVIDSLCPVISKVAAGSWSHRDGVSLSDVSEWLARPRHLSKNAFVLVVEGFSMYPEFRPNDYIYVEPTIRVDELQDGDLVVVQNAEFESTFKQLVIPNGDLNQAYLQPLNKDWKEPVMSLADCTLVGIVDSKFVKYRQK